MLVRVANEAIGFGDGMIEGETLEVLLTPEEIAASVGALADRLAPRLETGAVGLCLLLGGLWFAADLSRALSARGRSLVFDGLWLSSYGAGRESSGACELLAGPRRDLAGRQVLIIDDVADTGLSLREAKRIVLAAGAREAITAVFARKPAPGPDATQPDHFAWDAPGRFLVGYGMDVDGRCRELPHVAAAD
jgi:hypoxanthine phosphoribosyltransferase